MGANTIELYKMILAIRANFQNLKALGDELHREAGITTSMRAVLEYLHGGEPDTVPHIARAKEVSRQHIQKLVDGLAARGLVEFIPNPAHRRSQYVGLTLAGKQAFQAILDREKAVLRSLSGGMGEEGVAVALNSMDQLLGLVKKELVRERAATTEGRTHE